MLDRSGRVLQMLGMTATSPSPPGAGFRKPWEDAVSQARRRLAENPRDIAAHCSLAENLITLWCYGYLTREESIPASHAAVDAALSIDPDKPVAVMLDGILAFGDWNWSEAEEKLRRAVALDPGDASALHWLALFLAAMGRFEEAIPLSEGVYEISIMRLTLGLFDSDLNIGW